MQVLWTVGHLGIYKKKRTLGTEKIHVHRIQQFAAFYTKKLGFKEQVLQKCLWGEYYFDPKAKRVLLPKHLKGRNMKPMFVQFVLENIWAVYGSVIVEP